MDEDDIDGNKPLTMEEFKKKLLKNQKYFI